MTIRHTLEGGYKTVEVSQAAEDDWVKLMSSSFGLLGSLECTPGYYNFEGESNRRQDGNYNGGFLQYFNHMAEVRSKMLNSFIFD